MSESGWQRLRRIFRPSTRAEVDDEIAFHIDERAREVMGQGIDPITARRMAEDRFGPVRPIEEALMKSTNLRREREDRAEHFSDLRQDFRYALRSLRAQPKPYGQVYVPIVQMPYPGLRFVIRTSGDPLQAVAPFKQAVRGANPAATVKEVRTFESIVSNSLARQRFNMTLIAIFAVLALVLAIVGLYSVLALLVGQRQREIGVRLALGASPRDVVGMVVGEGARVTAAGLALGIAGAWAATRVLKTLIFGVSTTDAPTFALAAVLVALAALLGAYAPARRASRVDPKAALTSE